MGTFFIRECTAELHEKIGLIGSTIFKGDALQILRSLPSESVQCAVTSPPYWGLRDYGTEPQIWDDDPACQHIWGRNVGRNVGRWTGVPAVRKLSWFYGSNW